MNDEEFRKYQQLRLNYIALMMRDPMKYLWENREYITPRFIDKKLVRMQGDVAQFALCQETQIQDGTGLLVKMVGYNNESNCCELTYFPAIHDVIYYASPSATAFGILPVRAVGWLDQLVRTASRVQVILEQQ